jgi:hypothetical protein
MSNSRNTGNYREQTKTAAGATAGNRSNSRNANSIRYTSKSRGESKSRDTSKSRGRNDSRKRIVCFSFFLSIQYTANEGPVRIQYYVWFPFKYSQKWNCYFQDRMFCLAVPTLIYLWEIYIFPGSVCLFFCREICGPILHGNIQIAHRHMNVEIGTDAAQFPEKEYINGIFFAVWFTPLAAEFSCR